MNVLLVSVRSKESKGGIAVWTEPYITACESHGIHCDIVNTAKSGRRTLFNELARARRIYRQLVSRLTSGTYDVVHFNTNIGYLGVIRDYGLAKRIHKQGIPIVLHFHCDIPYWVTNRLIHHYLKKILALSDLNFVLCEESHRYLQETFGVDSVKVANFVDESLVVAHKPIQDVLRTICFVGRISRAKGAAELYEVARRFPAITFRLVGRMQPDMADAPIPPNVVLVGTLSHDEVIVELDAADAFLFPTHTEGFSLALAEAMARGLPCIATDVGANADMLEDKGGIVVRKQDTAAMQTAIERLADPAVRRQMSEWNRRKVREQYTSSAILQVFNEQYQAIRKQVNAHDNL